MPKTPAGTPNIKVCHGRLQIVLTYRGVRKYLSMGLPDSKVNRVYAEMVKTRIASDLLNDNFDPTLDKYKREALKPDPEAIEIEDMRGLSISPDSLQRSWIGLWWSGTTCTRQRQMLQNEF